MKGLKLICCLLLFTVIACKQKRESQEISSFYNRKLNLDYIQSGGTNYYMKYLLDTIMRRNCRKTDKDTKYCLFSFPWLRDGGAKAYFIDQNDSIYYWLQISEQKEAGNLSGKLSKGKELLEFNYVIKTDKLTSKEMINRCEYQVFFNHHMTCTHKNFVTDSYNNELLLKFWNSDTKLNFEFYRFYDGRVDSSPNQKIKLDSSCHYERQKIRFVK